MRPLIKVAHAAPSGTTAAIAVQPGMAGAAAIGAAASGGRSRRSARSLEPPRRSLRRPSWHSAMPWPARPTTRRSRSTTRRRAMSRRSRCTHLNNSTTHLNDVSASATVLRAARLQRANAQLRAATNLLRTAGKQRAAIVRRCNTSARLFRAAGATAVLQQCAAPARVCSTATAVLLAATDVQRADQLSAGHDLPTPAAGTGVLLVQQLAPRAAPFVRN